MHDIAEFTQFAILILAILGGALYNHYRVSKIIARGKIRNPEIGQSGSLQSTSSEIQGEGKGMTKQDYAEKVLERIHEKTLKGS